MDDEPNDAPADESNEPADDGDKPAEDQPVEQSDEQPADSDQPAEQSEEQAADEQPTEQSEEQPAESDQPAEQSEEQPAQQSDDQPADSDQPADDSEFRKRCSALLAKHEGRMKHVYLDTLQIPSIGIGFNLKRGGAREALAKVGADYDQVLAGTQDLSDEQIDALFNRDLDTALATAQRQVPNFANLHFNARLVIVDMAFMGEGGLAGFKKMIAALKELDYNTAANEMMNSQWYVQVKNRGVEDVALMHAAAS